MNVPTEIKNPDYRNPLQLSENFSNTDVTFHKFAFTSRLFAVVVKKTSHVAEIWRQNDV